MVVIIRLCDHKGECVNVNYEAKLDGRVVEIPLYRLDELYEALGVAQRELEDE